ncbi:hypothetical protein IV38_GL001284 [Lactobacillus selangorensis]|uniref:HTH marR-type domain-containing protein n=1 Tax=Lactobacillus selangorensis TaxID=81857 RepID=A0A0R2FUZ8_9LACO|nr:MarR family winged helix-turn-helix transcriptional regulator [Lactobacillus selangorensis]KRN29068.1 hypothetical protein IV38_GL001284 [Lactobacillus selangorensis]
MPENEKTQAALFGEIGPIGSIVVRLVETHSSYIKNELSKLGIYRGQDMILKSLSKNDNQSQKKLSAELCLNHSTITISVGRMENRGLVTLSKSQKDKRVTLVGLTDQGREMAKQVDKIWGQAEQQMQVNLTKTDLSEFKRISNVITKNLE